MLGNTTDYIAYALKRGVVIDPEMAGVQLVKATDYLNSLSWVGEKADPWQEDAWPRKGIEYGSAPLVMEDGTTIEVTSGADLTVYPVPVSLITATYRLAMEVASGVDIMPTSKGGAKVIEERIEGAITMRYSEGSVYDLPEFPYLDSMIAMYIDGSSSSKVTFKLRRG